MKRKEDIAAFNRIKNQADGIQKMGGEDGVYLDLVIKKRINEILSLLNQRQGEF